MTTSVSNRPQLQFGRQSQSPSHAEPADPADKVFGSMQNDSSIKKWVRQVRRLARTEALAVVADKKSPLTVFEIQNALLADPESTIHYKHHEGFATFPSIMKSLLKRGLIRDSRGAVGKLLGRLHLSKKDQFPTYVITPAGQDYLGERREYMNAHKTRRLKNFETVG